MTCCWLIITSIPGFFPYIPGFPIGIQLWFLINMLWGYMNQPRYVDGSALFTWAVLACLYLMNEHSWAARMTIFSRCKWGEQQGEGWWAPTSLMDDVRFLKHIRDPIMMFFDDCHDVESAMFGIGFHQESIYGSLVWGTKEFGVRNGLSSKWIYHTSWYILIIH